MTFDTFILYGSHFGMSTHFWPYSIRTCTCILPTIDAVICLYTCSEVEIVLNTLYIMFLCGE